MKKLFLLLALLIMPLTACASWDTIPPPPHRAVATTYEICFVDAWTGYVDCGWYPYSAFGYYRNYFTYYRYNGIHIFYHQNWTHNGVRVKKMTPVRQGRVVKGKGYTQYKETPSTGRYAVPRGSQGSNPPQAAQVPQRRNMPPSAGRTAVPRTQPQVRPPQRTAPPKVSPPRQTAVPKARPPQRTTPPKRVVKPRGGGG